MVCMRSSLKCSQLLRNHYLRNLGRESLTTAILANLLFPYCDGQKSLFLIETWVVGLFWWYSGREATCQCRRHGFDPWSGKIPHVVEQLSPRATLLSPSAVSAEACPLGPVFATRETLCVATKTQRNQKIK